MKRSPAARIVTALACGALAIGAGLACVTTTVSADDSNPWDGATTSVLADSNPWDGTPPGAGSNPWD